MALRLSSLAFTFCFLFGGQILAEEAGYAKGLVIYLAPGDTQASATAVLYRKYTKSFPHSYFDVGGSSPLAVENGRILKMLDLAPLYGNVSSDAERLLLARFSTEIADISQQYPKSAEVLKSLTQVLEGFLNRYDNGEVRLNGTWENAQDYRDRLAAVQQASMERAAMQQKLQDQDRMQYDNLEAAYPPIVAEEMLDEYDSYIGVVTHFLATRTDKKDLGPIDPGLYERSKLIPAPLNTDEAGIYASDSEYGPAVIWTAKNGRVVSMVIGFCLLTDPETNEITNEREMAQVENFVNRIDPGFLDFLPTFMAANKIEKILNKPVQGKNTSSAEVETDVFFASSFTLGNGEIVQPIFFYLF